MRQGDDIDAFNNDDSMKTTTTATAMTTPSTSIPTSTRTRTGTMGSSINLNNYVDEKMIEDLQNQHLQMMQMQQQQQHQSSYSVTIPQPQILQPSAAAAATIIAVATNSDTMVGIYDQLHNDLTSLNIRLLRSKVSIMHRLLPKNKQSIERFVNFLIKFIL